MTLVLVKSRSDSVKSSLKQTRRGSSSAILAASSPPPLQIHLPLHLPHGILDDQFERQQRHPEQQQQQRSQQRERVQQQLLANQEGVLPGIEGGEQPDHVHGDQQR